MLHSIALSFVGQISVLFIMHDIGIGGGSISILQEALTMREMGYNVSIAVPSSNGKPSSVAKSLFSPSISANIADLIIEHNGSKRFPFKDSEQIISIAKDFDVVVATFCLTVSLVRDIINKYPKVLGAYYIQDYEPWFWESPLMSTNLFNNNSNKAINKQQSFQALHNFSLHTYNDKSIVKFAKTQWLIDIVKKYHPSSPMTYRVIPSINHNVYHPGKRSISARTSPSRTLPIRIAAMIRPRTPRRNGRGAYAILLKVAAEFGGSVSVVTFGCGTEELYGVHQMVVRDPTYADLSHILFNATSMHHKGIIQRRDAMANLFREIDIFLDVSHWQAFGRTGVEAMACGCISIMPRIGAAPEICEMGKSCLFHDYSDLNGIYASIVQLIQNGTMRHELITNGVRRSADFSLIRSASSLIATLQHAHFKHANNRIL